MTMLNFTTAEIRALSLACDFSITRGANDLSADTRKALDSAYLKITRTFTLPALLVQAHGLLEKISTWDGPDERERTSVVRRLEQAMAAHQGTIEPPG